MRGLRALLLLLAGLALALPARAQDFAGKTITLIAGQPVGGGIDNEMRLVARFLGRYLPGNPHIVPQNMPGAGGLVLGHYMYAQAKPDGLTLGMPGRSGFLLGPVSGDGNAHYDLQHFTWIGTSASTNYILWIRRDRHIANLAELRRAAPPVIVGGTNPGVSNIVIPAVLAKYEKLPLKIVAGYPGFGETVIALERGEIEAIYTHAPSLRADLVSSGLLVPVLQTFDREPNLPAIDRIVENPREKALLGLLTAPLRLGLPLLGPPGLPDAMASVLRRAYVAMASSADYRAEAARRGFEIGAPMAGDEIARTVAANLTGVPADIVAEYRAVSEGK